MDDISIFKVIVSFSSLAVVVNTASFVTILSFKREFGNLSLSDFFSSSKTSMILLVP